MYPYLDLAGFRRRTVMGDVEIDAVEAVSPGYVVSRIAVRSSYINGRLRKRYGTGRQRSSLPLGQTPPILIASSGPQVALQGRPILGSLQMFLEVTTGGGLGAAAFRWSKDGAQTFTTGATVAASVSLPGTGMSATFPDLTYSVGDSYAAATPVPEIVLGWLTILVTWDAMRKRGLNPHDPSSEMLKADVETVMAELKEAADSKDGLFDLPSSEDSDSAVTTGGPLGYSDASPYAWQTRQARRGYNQDGNQGWPFDVWGRWVP